MRRTRVQAPQELLSKRQPDREIEEVSRVWIRPSQPSAMTRLQWRVLAPAEAPKDKQPWADTNSTDAAWTHVDWQDYLPAFYISAISLLLSKVTHKEEEEEEEEKNSGC